MVRTVKATKVLKLHLTLFKAVTGTHTETDESFFLKQLSFNLLVSL